MTEKQATSAFLKPSSIPISQEDKFSRTRVIPTKRSWMGAADAASQAPEDVVGPQQGSEQRGNRAQVSKVTQL